MARRQRRLAVARHVECDDPRIAGDALVVEDGAILAAVSTGGMQTDQRNAPPGLFEIDSIALARVGQVQVAPGDRLDDDIVLCRRRRRLGGQFPQHQLQRKHILTEQRHVAADLGVAGHGGGVQGLKARFRAAPEQLLPGTVRGPEAQRRIIRRGRQVHRVASTPVAQHGTRGVGNQGDIEISRLAAITQRDDCARPIGDGGEVFGKRHGLRPSSRRGAPILTQRNPV